MKVFTQIVGATVTFLIALFLLAALGAFPTKWLVNYLFSSTFLIFIFGVGKINFWQALCLNIFTGIIFRSSATSSK